MVVQKTKNQNINSPYKGKGVEHYPSYTSGPHKTFYSLRLMPSHNEANISMLSFLYWSTLE